ncbi:MAG: DUF3109 family protein [Bacteroidetes bacterium]|jgi:hypothetical protein|nr:DUF3109 family protein [Bacteroidota bacterium]
MIKIGRAVVSLEVIENKFCCDLGKCFGSCCVQGDSGAPLEDNETGILDDEWENVKPFLRKEGIEAIEKQGRWIVDEDNDKVTPLVDDKKECAYAIFENGIAKCGIEKAYNQGKTDFRKPVSCHLYPVRIQKYRDFDALNYDQWNICKPAIPNGQKNGIPVYTFVKDALIRKYGEEWYHYLTVAVEKLKESKDMSGSY